MTLWNRINNINEKRNGIEIDKAKTILDDFEKLYHLPHKMEINLSTPIELNNLFRTDTTVIMSSEVKIRFSALSDEMAFRLIDSIVKNFPGFVKIKQLNVQKNLDINNDLIIKIDEGTLPEVVTVTLDFDWRDFKDIVS